MNGRDVAEVFPQTSPSQQYMVVSLAALGVILLVLLHWGMGRWSFLPVLLAVLGVILRWRITPVFTIVLLAGLLLAGELTEQPPLPGYRGRGFNLSDWFLCGAVLAFCAAQYRLQGMSLSILPSDPTARQDPPDKRPVARSPHPGITGSDRAKTDQPRRNPHLVSPSEIGWLVLSLPIWAFLAQLCWGLLPAGGEAYGITAWTWRGIVLTWLLVLGVLVVAGLLSYAGQRRLRQREARLFLQDVLWQDNGLEQRRLNRSLAWADFRGRRKEKR